MSKATSGSSIGFDDAGTTPTSFVIIADTVKFIGPGQEFEEPGEFSDWVIQYRIAPGVTVFPTIVTDVDPSIVTTIACTMPVTNGHINGSQIHWTTTNGDLDGDPLTGSDFAALDAIWVIDSILGLDLASVATAKTAAEAIVRAKYRVVLEFDGAGDTDVAMRAGNLHAGDWTDCRCLFIATTDDATVGVITGTGTSSGIGDGPGGVAIVPGSCFFNFSNAGWLCDYGGVINADKGLALFSADECARTDFGGIIYANDCILIGGEDYGYRANHGGSAWLDGCYVRGCSNGVQIDNSPGMARIHGCDIQFCYEGASAQYGGSLKAAFGALFLGDTLTATGDGVTATVTFDGGRTVGIGKVITILDIVPTSFAGQHTVTASSSGSVSFLDNATGPQTVAGRLFLILPATIKNNARSQVTLNLGGDFDGRALDMISTELFPSGGGPAAPPVYGLSLFVGGTAKLDNTAEPTVSGHDKDLYMEGGTVSAVGVTFTTAEGPSSIAITPDGNSVYSVYRPVYRGPQTKTADFTLAAWEKSIVNNAALGIVATLPSAATCPGREVYIQNTSPQTVTSATANIVPKGGGAAATGILPATSGAWAILVAMSAGTWRVMASGI